MVFDIAAIDDNETLEHAFRFTSYAWFPADPGVVSSVQDKLRSGAYKDCAGTMLQDLGSDFSLYLLCLKDLQQAAGPEELCSAAMLSKISALIEVRGATLSKYSLTEITDFQAARLRDCIISTSAAGLLAENCGIKRDLALSAGLMRQLGLTLIAWNYPTLYSELLEMQRNCVEPGDDLDACLYRVLGFSPIMLGLKFARSWQLSDAVVNSLTVPHSTALEAGLSSRTASPGARLAHICEIGEALARANNPEIYPTARHDWDVASRAIKRELGAQGLFSVNEHARQLTSRYARFAPVIAEHEAAFNCLRELPAFARTLMERNVHIKACSAAVQLRFAHLYGELDEKKVSSGLLRSLFHDVVPSLGFENICVFMLDPSVNSLRPLLRIGTPAFTRLREVPLDARPEELNPIRQAFSSAHPLLETGLLRGQGTKNFLAGALGEQRRVGVVYAEASPDMADGRVLALFRAVLTAANDLLHLG